MRMLPSTTGPAILPTPRVSVYPTGLDHFSAPLAASRAWRLPSSRTTSSVSPRWVGDVAPAGPSCRDQIVLPAGSSAHPMPPPSTPYITPAAVTVGDAETAWYMPVTCTLHSVAPLFTSSAKKPFMPPT